MALQKQQKPDDLRNRIATAKNTLGLKDLNVSAALGGHNYLMKAAQKNPNAQFNQLLNKMPTNMRKHYLTLTSAMPSDLLTSKVPAAQFRGTMQKIKQTNRTIMAHYEHEKGEAILEVRYVPNLYQNPPMMLILKRTGFRIFPDGQRVAIYKNDKTGFVFSVPFNQTFNTNVGTPQGGAAITGQQEELEIDDESFEELIEAIEESGLEQLDEANVQRMGRVKLIRARVRGGKVQRRKKVSAVKGYTLRGGKLTRMSAKERLDRKRGARRGKIKRKAKLARALIKRKRSLRKRKSLGL